MSKRRKEESKQALLIFMSTIYYPNVRWNMYTDILDSFDFVDSYCEDEATDPYILTMEGMVKSAYDDYIYALKHMKDVIESGKEQVTSPRVFYSWYYLKVDCEHYLSEGLEDNTIYSKNSGKHILSIAIKEVGWTKELNKKANKIGRLCVIKLFRGKLRSILSGVKYYKYKPDTVKNGLDKLNEYNDILIMSGLADSEIKKAYRTIGFTKDIFDYLTEIANGNKQNNSWFKEIRT